MRASIAADPERGPGYGIIEIEGAGDILSPSFTLQRASDGKCLSSGGWQESETAISPQSWNTDDSKLRLHVGPEVIDELDSLDAYRISLPGQGACAMAVGRLIYSSISGGQGMGGASAPEAPAAVSDPDPDPISVTPPELAPEPEPEPEAPLAEQPLQMAHETGAGHSGRGKTAIAMGVLALLLCAGLAVWWFVLRELEGPPLPQPPGQSASNSASGAQSAENGAAPKAPLATAREQLRGEALPDVSLAMAKPMRKADASPEECDAAFLLLEDAAQKGNAEAMLLVGEYYDPTASLPRGSIPVDMTQARRWYDEALHKGHDKALPQAALDRLKEYAKAEEARGNAEARALLQSWN